MNHYAKSFSNALLLTSILFVSFVTFAEENPDIHTQQIDLLALNEQINQLMETYHYNPSELSDDAYEQQVSKIRNLAKSSESLDDFVAAFNQAWQQGPFSHVRLAKAQQPAEELAKLLDKMNVGGNGVQLEINEDIAILTINTMMGQDTIEQLFDAYETINNQNASFLIIDLRNNDGGAFAIRPLIGHLISQPSEGGFFISRNWTSTHADKPSLADIEKVSPWEGWSIERFWQDVQTSDILRIQHHPMTPRFEGKVYVLVSGQTFSAAEIATSALKGLPNVTIIGEVTAGEVLSQSLFDVPPGLHLFLPVADYYSANGTRIEGQGISPDILIDATQAMSAAHQQIEHVRGKD